MTEIKYISTKDNYLVKYKSGKKESLNEEEMKNIGFSELALYYAFVCPDTFVTISQE